MPGTGKSSVRSHLKSLPAADCRELVLELWERFPAVRDYFAGRFSSAGSQAVLAKARAEIAREFSISARNPSGDPAVARRVIAEFRRSQVRPEATIELLLFHVEAALEFMTAFGDERPAKSIAKAFADALRLADSENLIARFQAEFARLAADAETIGWGVGEDMREQWLQYGPTGEEPEDRGRG